MNRQIAWLFGIILVLFAILAGFSSYWSVLGADSVKSEALNRRPLLEQQQIPRGLILAADGTRLAVDRSIGHGQTKRYFRTYPQSNLFSHAVGYAFISRGDSGIEHSYNDFLSGNGS